MVRFDTKLVENSVVEWRKFYVDYGELKRMLLVGSHVGSDTRNPLDPHQRLTELEPLEQDALTLAVHKLVVRDNSDVETSASSTGVAMPAPAMPSGVAVPSPSTPPVPNSFSSTTAAAETAAALRDANFRSELTKEIVKIEKFYCNELDGATSELLQLESSRGASREYREARRRSKVAAYSAIPVLSSSGSSFTIKKQTTTHSATDRPTRVTFDVQDSFCTAESSALSTTPHNSLKSRLLPGHNDHASVVTWQTDDDAAIEIDLESLRRARWSQLTASMRFQFLSKKQDQARLYRRLCLLEEFCLHNLTAIEKLLKKHDEILSAHSTVSFMSSKSWLQDLGEVTSFVDQLRLGELKSRLVEEYTLAFCEGSSTVARSELIMARNDAGTAELVASESSFRLGARIGACILLAMWVLWECVEDFAFESRKDQLEEFGECQKATGRFQNPDASSSVVEVWFKKVFPVYRGILTFVAALWCWAVVIYIMDVSHVNYALMLKLDHRTSVTSISAVLFEASNATAVVLSCFLIHFKIIRCDMTPFPAGTNGSVGFWCIVPFIYVLYKFFFPWHERKQVVFSVLEVLQAPFVSVTLLSNFASNILSSLAKPLSDTFYSFCFFLSGDAFTHLGDKGICESAEWMEWVTAIVLILPSWLRMMQCLRRYFDSRMRHPHLSNAFKYALYLLVAFVAKIIPPLEDDR